MLPALLLASQSPRRRQLLENLGLPFSVTSPAVDEAHPEARDLLRTTQDNALLKARAAAKDFDGIVIGADTLVAIDEHVLAKPASAAEAAVMLRRLSGREHVVVTGLALVYPSRGAERVSAVSTRVKFRHLTDREIQDYVRTREPYDKAGGYAIQGMASVFVEQIAGSYTNVVGLPIEQLLRELEVLGGVPLWQWFA